mmetsp:Transcript_94978/g.188139  ORF Transcript_94978/g.188139 Transcript_94978/m.188139 type:complete len:343 (-) Transcript_94978:297-1325(-)
MAWDSWLSFGTTLSGIASSVNGLHNLYCGLSTIAAGWFVTAKASVVAGAGVGAAGLGSMGAMVGVGAGFISASAGLAYFVHVLAQTDAESPPCHAPQQSTADAQAYPSPDWLSLRVLNWAVIGRVGSGKSTFINTIRCLKANDPGAASVGVGHTTTQPQPYNFNGQMAETVGNMARIWDVPGAGTKQWPCASYLRDAGLRYFDGVVFVTSGAFSETDLDLIQQLLAFKVPYYVVRNKVDQDVVNNAEDNGARVDETLSEIRQELLHNGCDPLRTFLISAKDPHCGHYDFGLLLRTMALDVSSIRGQLPEFQNEIPKGYTMTAEATAAAAARMTSSPSAIWSL